MIALEKLIAGDFEGSIEQHKKLVEKYPEEKLAFSRLGRDNYALLGKYEEAARYFNKVIEIDPLDKFAYNMLAYSYNGIGDFEKSIWAINKYIEIA